MYKEQFKITIFSTIVFKKLWQKETCIPELYLELYTYSPEL